MNCLIRFQVTQIALSTFIVVLLELIALPPPCPQRAQNQDPHHDQRCQEEASQ